MAQLAIMNDITDQMTSIEKAIDTLLELMGHRTNSPIWPTVIRGLLLIVAQQSRINNRLTSLELKIAERDAAYEENTRILLDHKSGDDNIDYELLLDLQDKLDRLLADR